MNSKNPIPQILAFSGAIPFVLCAILLTMDIKTLPVMGSVDVIINTYSLAILSFMAGSLWGLHLSMPDSWGKCLPLMSNAITLVAWFAFLLLSARFSLIVMACCFLALLIIDAYLKEADKIGTSYYRLRCWVSKIVIASLCVASIMLA